MADVADTLYSGTGKAAAYGRYAGPPSRAELERVFFLDDEDPKLVDLRRGDHMKAGFALQMVTVRRLGTFLEDPLDVPGEVLDFVAGQLGIANPAVVKRHTERAKTKSDHQQAIVSRADLRSRTAAMLPRVDLPEVILEVMSWAPELAEAFTPVSGGRSRLDDLPVWVAACLAAHAMNIGYRPVAKKGVPALERARLSHVFQNYVRPETLAAANAPLVARQAGLEEDMARLSPFVSRHLGVHGTYSFVLPDLAPGAIRDLRDPDAADEDDE